MDEEKEDAGWLNTCFEERQVRPEKKTDLLKQSFFFQWNFVDISGKVSHTAKVIFIWCNKNYTVIWIITLNLSSYIYW